MKSIIFLLLLPLWGFSQFKGKKIDVESFNAEKVDVSIAADFDLFELRYDIIRQTEEVNNTDSTCKTVDLDYHVLGFELGNFLFFDVKNNLSLRMDKIFGLDYSNDFIIQEESYPFRKNRSQFYTFQDATFYDRNGPMRRNKERFNIDATDKTIDKYYRNRYQFSVVKNDHGLYKKNNRRIIYRINNRGNSRYNTSKHPKRGNKYFKKKNSLVLNRRYAVCTNDDNTIIEIRHGNNKRSKPIYSIQSNSKEIIIYDRSQRGQYFNYSNAEIAIYNHKKMLQKYTRIE